MTTHTISIIIILLFIIIITTSRKYVVPEYMTTFPANTIFYGTTNQINSFKSKLLRFSTEYSAIPVDINMDPISSKLKTLLLHDLEKGDIDTLVEFYRYHIARDTETSNMRIALINATNQLKFTQHDGPNVIILRG